MQDATIDAILRPLHKNTLVVDDTHFRGCGDGCSLSRPSAKLSPREEKTLRDATAILERLKENATLVRKALSKHAA